MWKTIVRMALPAAPCAPPMLARSAELRHSPDAAARSPAEVLLVARWPFALPLAADPPLADCVGVAAPVGEDDEELDEPALLGAASWPPLPGPQAVNARAAGRARPQTSTARLNCDVIDFDLLHTL